MKILIALLLASLGARADCTLKITSDGVIGPGTYDYIERAISHADAQKCSSILYLINTPGGSLQSTRMIVEKIVNSPVPFLCLVYPGGGHAGSAGAIILQACHVNGAVEATNIGAATPITMGGEMDKDLRAKVMNDTISMMDGLVELRGRDKKFAHDIIEKAKAVDAKEAWKLGAIDNLPNDIEGFLKFSGGRKVKFPSNEIKQVQTGPVEAFDPDLRLKFLDIVTHPQVAYLMFMASLALLYFELTHAGMIAPGVFGALGLVISLMTFHMLEVRWGGVALIILGIGFMVAELFVPAFGALGIGGIVAFVAGSLLLYDPAVGSLPLSTILPSAIALGAAIIGIGYLALSTRKIKVKSNTPVGEMAQVVAIQTDRHSGKVEVHGEIWNFVSSEDLSLHDQVKIDRVEGLKLYVSRS